MENSTEHLTKSKYTQRCIIKTVIFILVGVILFSLTQKAFTLNKSDLQYSRMNSIYNEEDNALDAVYIGPSNVYAFWNPMIAWEEYGIAVQHYGSASIPVTVAEYLIREARKTQPDALYIVSINSLGEDGVLDKAMHYVVDNMPLSTEKLRLTNYMIKANGLSFADGLEYYFPIIRYHSRWNELPLGDSNWKDTIKNSSNYETYLTLSENATAKFSKTDETKEISQLVTDGLNSLLDYCDREDVRVLFVTAPQARGSSVVKKFNTVNNLISSRGYTVLDLINNIEDTNIDLTRDYYNTRHTNIHGAIKFTHYLSEYLIENYGFEDKRENPDYSSWNEALENYSEIISPYVLDFELDSTCHDYSLSAVDEISAKTADGEVTLSWEANTEADGYAVWRKYKNKWSLVGETAECSFTDVDSAKDKSYTYTVVPYTLSDSGILYGNFSYTGVTVKS